MDSFDGTEVKTSGLLHPISMMCLGTCMCNYISHLIICAYIYMVLYIIIYIYVCVCLCVIVCVCLRICNSSNNIHTIIPNNKCQPSIEGVVVPFAPLGPAQSVEQENAIIFEAVIPEVGMKMPTFSLKAKINFIIFVMCGKPIRNIQLGMGAFSNYQVCHILWMQTHVPAL